MIFLLSAMTTLAAQAQQHKLWYSQPARHWLEALPVGNSHLGAMVYGKTDTEEIQFNEETFWSGSPHNNNSPEAKAHLQEVRDSIFAGKEESAHALIDKYFIKGPHGQKYLPLGDLLGARWYIFHEKVWRFYLPVVAVVVGLIALLLRQGRTVRRSVWTYIFICMALVLFALGLRHERAYARPHHERNLKRRQRVRFLRKPSEQPRVTALQPHDAPSLPRLVARSEETHRVQVI